MLNLPDDLVIFFIVAMLLLFPICFSALLFFLLFTIRKKLDALNESFSEINQQWLRLLTKAKKKASTGPEAETKAASPETSIIRTTEIAKPVEAETKAAVVQPSEPSEKEVVAAAFVPPPLPTQTPQEKVVQRQISPTATTTAPVEEKPAAKKTAWFRLDSAVKEKLILCKNWLFYGQTEVPSDGDQSLEKLIASTWLLRAGVLVLLFTAVFLLKLSIERGILAPAGRVTLSYLAGIAFLLFGLHLHRGKYLRLGQTSAGLGLLLFYFSTFAMGSMYQLVPIAPALLIMILITICAGFIAHRFNALAIAIIAIIGGYATPVLLSSGSKNLSFLCIYMIFLGIGVLWLAAQRNWLPLNWLALIFNYSLFYLASYDSFSPAAFPILLITIIAFFLIYSAVTFVHNLRKNIKATVLEICAMLLNAALFFFSAVWLITNLSSDRIYLAPLSIALCAFYLGHIFYFEKKKIFDKYLSQTFLALAAIFLTLTFPILLSKHWLVAGWAIQATLMLKLGYDTKNKFLRALSWLLLIVCIEKLFCQDLRYAYYTASQITEKKEFYLEALSRIVMFLLPIACMISIVRICHLNAAKLNTDLPDEIDQSTQSKILHITDGFLPIIGVAVLFFSLLNYSCPLNLLAYRSSFWRLFVIVGSVVVIYLYCKASKENKEIWKLLFSLSAFVVILGKFFLSLSVLFPFITQNMDTSILSNHHMRNINFLFLVFVSCALIFLIYYFFRKFFHTNESHFAKLGNFLWVLFLFVYLNFELDTLLSFSVPGLTKGATSVLWAAFAFAFIYYGLRRDLSYLRYLGLSLFTIAVGKIFLYDLKHLVAIYRVLAFLAFGLILLTAAFLYLKFSLNTYISDSDSEKIQKGH